MKKKKRPLLWGLLILVIIGAWLSPSPVDSKGKTNETKNAEARIDNYIENDNLLVISEQEETEKPSSPPTLETTPQPTTKPTPKPTPQPTTKPTPRPTPEPTSTAQTYVLNTNTHKFHYPWCRSVDQMKEKNKWVYTGTREGIIEMGYAPCQNCHP